MTLILPKISPEQQTAIDHLNDNNIVIDSVAGSGKTTCILHIAQRYSTSKILLLTYNANLKFETRDKANRLCIENLQVHSYHSFCVNYYHKCAIDDAHIRNMFKKTPIPVPISDINFDMIVIDEAQDMKPLYYQLVCCINATNSAPIAAKMCIIGDHCQEIYSYSGADNRFIKYASTLFNFNGLEWFHCKLATSYRVTTETAQFINRCCLREDRIIAPKTLNVKPKYIICDTFTNPNSPSRVFDEVKECLKIYKPGDIFILAPTLKSRKQNLTPCCGLENRIKTELPHVLIYVTQNDKAKLDENLVKDKLVFSTFHQTKGLERKVVIIFGFDESYFKYYAREHDPHVLPNVLYVGITRAQERVILLHHYNNAYLPFLNNSILDEYCTVETHRRHVPRVIPMCTEQICQVTDLVGFLTDDQLETLMGYLTVEITQCSPSGKINMPVTVTGPQSTEFIADIIGTTIPAVHQYKNTGDLDILTSVQAFMTECSFTKQIPEWVIRKITTMTINTITVPDMLLLANVLQSFPNNYIHRVHQILDYNFLTQECIDQCLMRLQALGISHRAIFEDYIDGIYSLPTRSLSIRGRVDCIDRGTGTIYEFKCVNMLTREHYLQLAVYMYLFEIGANLSVSHQEPMAMKYILFNILTNEYAQIKVTRVDLVKFIDQLITFKYMTVKPHVMDIEFVIDMLNTYGIYYN